MRDPRTPFRILLAVVALALVALVVVASIWMQRFFSTRALFRLCARLLLFPSRRHSLRVIWL